MQVSQPSTTYEGLLSLLGRVRELGIALLIIDAALYVDIAVRATEEISLPSTPTFAGDATPMLVSVVALGLFGILYLVVGFASSVVRQLVVALLPTSLLMTSHKFPDLPLEERRDYVWLFELDQYLDVHHDEALKRAYDRQRRFLDNSKLVRENSAMAFALLFLALWRFPGSLTYALFAYPSWGPLVAIVALLWLALVAFGPSPTTFHKVNLPGRGAEISAQVRRSERQLKRTRTWMEDDFAGDEGSDKHPLRGKPVKYHDPFKGVAEDEWKNLD